MSSFSGAAYTQPIEVDGRMEALNIMDDRRAL